MKRENGITIVSLIITIIIMIILAGITVKTVLDKNMLQKKDQIEKNFNETVIDTDNKIKTERDKWNGII